MVNIINSYKYLARKYIPTLTTSIRMNYKYLIIWFMQFLQQIVLYKKYTFIRTFSSIVFLTCLLKKKSAKIILHYCSNYSPKHWILSDLLDDFLFYLVRQKWKKCVFLGAITYDSTYLTNFKSISKKLRDRSSLRNCKVKNKIQPRRIIFNCLKA